MNNQFNTQVKAIEQEYDVSLDDLGIEVQEGADLNDVRNGIGAIAYQRRCARKDTPKEIQDRWARGFTRNNDGGWMKPEVK